MISIIVIAQLSACRCIVCHLDVVQDVVLSKPIQAARTSIFATILGSPLRARVAWLDFARLHRIDKTRQRAMADSTATSGGAPQKPVQASRVAACRRKDGQEKAWHSRLTRVHDAGQAGPAWRGALLHSHYVSDPRLIADSHLESASLMSKSPPLIPLFILAHTGSSRQILRSTQIRTE